VCKHITFIDDTLIPEEIVLHAYEYTRETDPYDTLFVALSVWLAAPLWTGDKKLVAGLHAKGYDSTINTAKVISIVTDLETSAK
jgi:predicted nucleic acid-binding protein